MEKVDGRSLTKTVSGVNTESRNGLPEFITLNKGQEQEIINLVSD